MSAAAYDVSTLPGLTELWGETRGDARVRVGVLDGPVDLSHPAFRAAALEVLQTPLEWADPQHQVSRHGTQVAGLVFGAEHGEARGIAPGCTGVIAPVFSESMDGLLKPCSQLLLARAIGQCVDRGAHVINISSGQLESSGQAHPLLSEAIERCAAANILVVAAAGNEGCDCLHTPAALSSVLAVGATNLHGLPLESSNWGQAYQGHGILAPGEQVLCADSGGGVTTQTGTSYAAAIVTGAAALLVSLQIKRGNRPDPSTVKQALLRSATPCDSGQPVDRRRAIGGQLNLSGAASYLKEGRISMAHSDRHVGGVHASECGCHHGGACTCGSSGREQLVFALGQLDFTYASALDRESIAAHMGGDPDDPIQVLDYLEKHPWEAASLIWTLRVDGTWIYAVVPHGAFASEAYRRLRQILREQVSEGVERISLAGALSGQVRTMSGEVLPVVAPQVRCLYSWTTGALLGQYEKMQQDSGYASVVRDFLDRVYYGLRNLGLTAQDRALNYAVTNAMNALKVFESALKDGMQLDTIETERSSLCRPESECCDVKLTFFKPKETSSARRVYRFTVDVSRACPVTVGDVRSWFVR